MSVCPSVHEEEVTTLRQCQSGVMLHAAGAGTFFTEPQRAPSMKATFGKLHVQGFRSLQNLLTATVMSRSHSTSEASEVDFSESCSYT